MTSHELFGDPEHQKLASILAAKIHRTRGFCYPLADLEDFQNTALMALWVACVDYQEGHGTKFTSFAYERIWNALRHSLRDVHPRGRAACRREETGPPFEEQRRHVPALPDTSFDDADEVSHLLNQLPEREQKIVWLSAAEGQSLSEVSKQVGISKELTRKLLNRSLAKLQETA